MSITFKQPFGSSILGVGRSITRDATYGVVFSGSISGGYQEVYSVSDLQYDPDNTENAIPIQYTAAVSNPTMPWLNQPAKITLNNDSISSGRRRLGMVVHVLSTGTTYQYLPNNYDTLYDTHIGSATVSTTTILFTGTSSQDFIDLWIDNSVEGELIDPDGSEDGPRYTRAQASWKIFKPEYVSINSVPASEEIDDFNFSDAAIVVPAAWHGKKIVAVSAAIHDVPGTFNGGNIAINQVLASNQSTNSVTYNHPSDDQFLPHASLAPNWTLEAGSLLSLSTSATFGTNCKGYTATLQIV